MFTASDGGNFHYATMHNFSNDGMYCSSRSALIPNTVITIFFDDQPFKNAPKIYLGEIRRCEELESGDDSPLYGLGIKIIRAFNKDNQNGLFTNIGDQYNQAHQIDVQP
jgi:hypothetical protein